MIIGRNVAKKETLSSIFERAKWVRNPHEHAAYFINIETLHKKPPTRVISAAMPTPRQLLKSLPGHMLCCTLLSKPLLKVFVSLRWILLEKIIPRRKLFPLTLQPPHHFEAYLVFLCVIFIHPLDKPHKVTLFCLVLNTKNSLSHITLGVFLPPNTWC